MTVVIKYPAQSKKRNEAWFKKMESKNINWAQWGGWFDSDGSLVKTKRKNGTYRYKVVLGLKDRDPVELFSITFETSLCYREFHTTVPDGRKYTAKIYEAGLIGPRALWFADKIKKFILHKTKELEKFLDAQAIVYKPYSEKWTLQEWYSYIPTLVEGDGSISHCTKRGIVIYSINKFLLTYIMNEFKKLDIIDWTGPYQASKWLDKEKITPRKNPKYDIRISLKNKIKAKNFLENMIPNMTMDRKRQSALSILEWVNTKI